MFRVFTILVISVLFISESVLAYGSDERVANAITALVAKEDSIKPYELKIDVTSGKVILSGKVTTSANRQRIEEIARQVPGVKAVTNDIAVSRIAKFNGSGSPNDVCNRARSQLDSASDINDFNVEIDCADDVVTLTGTVQNAEDADRIERAIKKTAGVRDVVNYMRTPPELSDTYLEQIIRNDLQDKNRINLSGISISVQSGIVTFSGHVADHEEIDRILAATLMIKGVKDIKSQVTIGN